MRGTIVLAGVLLSSVALAAEPKPDFSIKAKALEASVFLDAKIKADPLLAANSLAEGKKWAETNRADAEKERESDPELFRNGPWTMERKYETRSVVDGRYVRMGGTSMAAPIVAGIAADILSAHPDAMSASSGPTTNIRAARTPTVRPTRSCGTN